MGLLNIGKDKTNKEKKQAPVVERTYKEPEWYTDIRPVNNIKELIDGSAELYPDNPAFWIKKFRGDEYHPITYTQLKHDIDALGSKLIDMGLKGKHIAVMGQSSYEWFVTYLAVVNGVGVIVPVDKEFDADQVQNVMDKSGSTVLFYTSGEQKKVESLKGIDTLVKMEHYGDRTTMDEPLVYKNEEGIIPWKKLVHEGEALLDAGYRNYVDAEIDNYAMSVLLFTSGTTGTPKGVMLSHWNIAFDVMEIARLEKVNEDDLTLSVLPIHHTYECAGTLLFLYRGASIAYSEGLKYISKNMMECHNTFFIAVPLLCESIYKKIWKTAKKTGKDKVLKRAMALNRHTKAAGVDLSSVIFKSVRDQLGGRLRMVVSGASAIAPEIVRGFSELGIHIVSGYGLTETSPMIAAMPAFSKDNCKKAGSTGICVKNGEMKIHEPNSDGIGEIWYRGANVMLGYYQMPELTAETITDGWFHTGDMGFFDPEGWLYITGRQKNVIVTPTGENIYPEEIEEIINEHPLVSESMVYALSKDGVETVAVQIFPEFDEINDQFGKIPEKAELNKLFKDIISDINGRLPNYKMIRTVIVREEDFVRTTTKKIKRIDNI